MKKFYRTSTIFLKITHSVPCSFSRKIVVFLFFLLPLVGVGQTLTISDGGQIGTSGTNWSSSGTNPVIITATGDATVNTSVVEDHLNAGSSVLLEGPKVEVFSPIDKTAGTDATLTIRAGSSNSVGLGRAMINADIQATSGALNIVLWSDYNNHNQAGSTISSYTTNTKINTNGGHFWTGGSASAQGSTTWNGLIVGNGPSVNAVGGTNQNSIDISKLVLTTNGGDVFMWAAPGAGGGIQGIAFASSSISTGTGDIILATDVIGGIDGAASLTSSGHLFLVPDGGAYPGDVTWSHNNIFSGTTNLSGTFGALNINAFNGLGGFTIGAYSGMVGLNFSNSSNITVSNRIYNAGSISLYGGNITLNENLTSIATSAAVLVNASGNIIQNANGIITTQGGGVVLRSNSNDTDNGRIELLGNITTNGGALYVGGGSANETLDGLSVPTGNATTTENNRNGINIWSANINTSGGNLRMRGQNTSVDGINTGVLVSNCTIQTGAGQLSLFGKRIGNPHMSGGLWLGTIINRSDATGNVTLSTTTGDILLEGVAELNNSHVYTHALMMAAGVTDQLNIGTTFGDIYLKGNGSNTMSQSGGTNAIRAQVGATTAGINITTNGGAIEFEGISANTSGNEGIAFSPASLSGSIKIGAAFTGNITFKTGSLRTEIRAVGAIDITSIRNVVFEGPAVGNFAADINITNEYDIGANITGLRFGKTDNTNATVNLFAPVSIKGPLSIYANHVNLSNSITTANADIFIQGATSISAVGQNRTLNSGSGNITLTTNLLSKTTPKVVIESTGTFTLQPFGTAFFSVDYGSVFELTGTLTSNTFTGSGKALGLGINNVSQLRGLVFGKEGNTTGFGTYHDWTVDGPITFIGGDILLFGNLTSTANAAAILLKAAGYITVAGAKTLQTNKGDLIFWADSDADNNGFIALQRDVILNSANGDTASGLSTGGAIVLAGGADDGANGGVSGDGKPDGFAQSASSPGINLGTAGTNTLSENHFYSGGGDVILRGKSSNAQGTDTYNNSGINQNGGFFVSAGTGRISILGESANFYGINLNQSPVNSTTPKLILNSAAITGDAIYLRGVSSSRDGLVFNSFLRKELLASGGGNITLEGQGNGTGYGVYFIGPTDVLSSSGTITVDGGTRGIQNTNQGHNFGRLTGSAIPSSSAAIIFRGDRFFLFPNGSGTSVITSGTFTLEPVSNSFSTPLSLPSTLNLASSISGFTLGKPTNTVNITMAVATSIAGPITVYGGDIAINGALTATSSDINLHASGAVTQTAPLTANRLGLHGPGTFALSNTANNVATIAGGDNTNKLGGLIYIDAAGGLSVGSVNPTGIYSSGAIELATLSGDLLVNEPIVSTFASGDAVKLFADLDQTAGNEGD